MVAVTAPLTSTLMRQASRVGGGLVLGIEQRLEGRIGAAGLEACRDADAGEEPLPAQAIALRDQRGIVRLGQHLVDDGVVVAAVIGGAARNQIRELLGADQVAPPHLQAIEPAMPGHLLERALDGVIGGRLAEGAHRLLHRLVRRHRDGAVLHAPDAVRPDDRADRLAELERRAPGVSADIVERAHLHRADHAGVVEGDLDIEVALGTVGVAGAHVLEPVLDQPHREAEPAGEVADQHRVLDAALDPVAAAHVHVVVDAHGGARQLERERDLVGKARHLHRGEDVEHLAPGVPARQSRRRFRPARSSCAPTSPAATGDAGCRRNPARPRPRRRCDRAARWSRDPRARAGCRAHRRPRRRARTAAARNPRAPARRRLRRARACPRPPPPPIRLNSARHRRRADAAAPSGCRGPPAAAGSRRQARGRRARSARPAWRAPRPCRSR